MYDAFLKRTLTLRQDVMHTFSSPVDSCWQRHRDALSSSISSRIELARPQIVCAPYFVVLSRSLCHIVEDQFQNYGILPLTINS